LLDFLTSSDSPPALLTTLTSDALINARHKRLLDAPHDARVLSSQILRIARRSMRLRDFLYDAAELLSRMARHQYPLPLLWARATRFVRGHSWPQSLGRASHVLPQLKIMLRRFGLAL
jgi:hypothetical protein